MSEEQDWCTIESDPGLFTELIAAFGARNIEVEEVYSFDQHINSSYGLIFLFKYIKETDNRNIVPPEHLPSMFFARQVISNACATQALLSVLLNNNEIEIGENLNEFKRFTMSFDAECKGLAIGNNDRIREAHNMFARPNPFHVENSKEPSGTGDAFHFVAFVPFEGRVYELDGLKAGPIDLGAVEAGNDWLNIARPAVEQRISRYSESEIQFALMSIRACRIWCISRQIEELKGTLEIIDVNAQTETEGRIRDLQELLQTEELKRESYRIENERRRHNYIPMILELVNILAKKRKLAELISAQR